MSDIDNATVLDGLMAGAWHGFVEFASRDEGIMKFYREETGGTFGLPRSSMEVMIDDATGKSEAEAYAFLDFVTVRLWGLDQAPEPYRKDYAARHGGEAA